MTLPPWWCVEHRLAMRVLADSVECPSGHSYPIVAGIPRFVTGPTYADAFGAQWNRHRQTQLDSHTGLPISRVRLRRNLGELWDRLEGALVLEAGCGAGRFTELLLERGAIVVSIDLSKAVEANGANCPPNADHAIAQADVMRIPTAPRTFDVVIGLGMIQHTPNPGRTIAALCGQVRPGGWLVIDHYARKLAWYTRTSGLFRQYFRRLPPEQGLRQTAALVRLLLPINRAARRSHVLSALLFRLSPIMTYYYAYPELNEQQQREWALLDTHDSLTDRYQHRRTVREIRDALLRLGLTAVECTYAGNGVEARGRRPA